MTKPRVPQADKSKLPERRSFPEPGLPPGQLPEAGERARATLHVLAYGPDGLE